MAKLTGPMAWEAFVKKAFPGNYRIKTGRPKIICANAAPVNSTDAAPIGTLWLEMASNNASVANCHVNTANVGTWVKINA